MPHKDLESIKLPPDVKKRHKSRMRAIAKIVSAGRKDLDKFLSKDKK